MPLEGDDYVPKDSDTIADETEATFSTVFADGDVNIGSILEAIFRARADTLAQNQERALDRLFDAAYLDTADGADLDRVTDIIGIERRAATHATGVARWVTASPTTSDKIVPRGTQLQTDTDEPTVFETTEARELSFVTGFESGTLNTAWTGDTGVFSVQSSTALAESFSAAASGTGLIYRTDNTFERGDTIHTTVQLSSGADGGYVFAYNGTGDYYEARVDETTLSLDRVSGGTRTTLTSTSVSLSTGTPYRLDVDWGYDGEITLAILDSNENILAETAAQDTTFRNGGVGLRTTTSATTYFDQLTSSAVVSNIRAVEGGVDGNLAAGALTIAPSPPSGFDGWRNPIPTGNPNFDDTDGTQLTVGQPRETDDELRRRARETVTKGGSATVDALLSSLVNEFGDGDPRGVDNVESVSIFTNRTTTDNANGNGLPAKSFEAVVYGGDDRKIAQAIFDTASATSRPVGGNVGVEVTKTIEAVNGQDFEVSFSRPTTVAVDVTVDLVVTDTFDGPTKTKDRIVEYIGGTDSGGGAVLGTDVGEDVVLDEIEQRVMDDSGVRAVTNVTTTPSATTDTNGVDVVAVGDTEVARTDATDGSITLNVTEV